MAGTESEKLGELYVQIKADMSQLESEMKQLKEKLSKESKEYNEKLKFKARFDNSIAKLKLSELQKYRERLQKEFEKKVLLNVDSASINRTRQKIASVDSQLQGVGKSATSLGSKIVSGIVALGAVSAVFTTLKQSIKLYYESAKAVAGVEQAVKRTGMAAGYTADQLTQMAAKLQELTGVDDDEILKGVTKQLLTFTNVTGDSFSRAQQAVLDLNSVIADGDVSGLTAQAIQLGKALENPIVGVGALQRAGVTFTAEQKRMIKGFVEQNDLLSAQNVILSEVESKYGGQAEAMAKALKGTKQFSAAWGDLQEAIGNFLTSAPGLTWVIEELTKGFANWSKLFQGQAFYLKQLRVELQNLQQTVSGITFNNLTNSTKEFRDNLKQYNKEQLEENKKQWQALDDQIKLEQEKVRLNDDAIESLRQQQVQLNKISSIQRGEIEAIDKYEKKIEESGKQWDSTGKTIDQIKDRIAELELMKGSLAPDVDAKEINQLESDIESLNKLIQGGSDGSKFFSNIPQGYTAEMVAEFEKLKFAVSGYVEFRKEQIELMYNQEVHTAEGNSEKIKEAEEKKNLSIAKLNQELTDFKKEAQDKQIKDTEDFFNEIDAKAKENQETIKRQEAEYYSQRLDATDSYYEGLKTKNEDYFNYKVQKIQEEADALLLATNNSIMSKQFELEQLKLLEQEYFEWRIQQWVEQSGVIGDIFIAELAGLQAGYDTFWQSLADADMNGKQRLEEIWQSTKSAVLQTIGDIVKGYIQSWIKAQVVGQTFKAIETAAGITMGATLAAAYAPAAAFASIMSFGGAAVAGSAGLASTVALAQVLAIPKFGSGTDGYMKVPDGYSGDNYPIMMKSGEDFRVRTPAQQKSDEQRMVGIERRLDILNANLIDKNFAPVINSSLSIDGKKLTQEIISVINKMEREGRQIGNF